MLALISLCIPKAPSSSSGSRSQKRMRKSTLTPSILQHPMKSMALSMKSTVNSSGSDSGNNSAEDENAAVLVAHSASVLEPTPWLFKQEDDLLDYGCFIVEEPPPEDIQNDKPQKDILIKKMQTASAAAVEPQNVDVYFDALRNYISELWEVQFYRPFKFKKEGEKRSPPRVTWPTSRGFCRLKNLLSEGANDDWIKDVISRHSEEYASPTIIKSVLKDIEEAEWAVAGLLAVAELLKRTETALYYKIDRIEWLFVVDEMFRLAQYCKQFNQKDELWRRMKCGAIAVILDCSIDCCWLVDPSSKFEFNGRYAEEWDYHSDWLRSAKKKLREECDTLAKTMTEDLDNQSGSLSNLECYSWGFRLWPQREDEGGPSSVHESSTSFPKAGSTGSTGEEESEDKLGPESEDDGENESEDDGENESEDEGGPSSVHESSASFPKAGSTGSTGEEE